jgi:multiple antibiotic resistance protein
MSDIPSFALLTFSAIFFVVDPFAVIPMYLVITKGDSAEKKLVTARRASIATTVTLLSFAIAGGLIFKMFGITLGAFKIAGGILLFLMAVDMIRAQRSRLRTTPEEESEGAVSDEVAIIPLAIPMLSGPGSIATVMVLMSRSASKLQVAIVMACIVVTGILTFLVLRAATMLERTLKNTGLNILTRLMGLILAAVAVQFVISGIQDSFPQLIAKN